MVSANGVLVELSVPSGEVATGGVEPPLQADSKMVRQSIARVWMLWYMPKTMGIFPLSRKKQD